VSEVQFELLAGRTYVARGPSNVGLYDSGEGRAILIDSGNDDDAGKRLLRAAEAMGLRISLIANTHSHADHCGGNAYLQGKTGCGIAATRTEAAFVERPSLEPSYVWGAFPLPPLRNKFLMAKPSRVTEIAVPPCPLAGTDIRVLPLPGHSFEMVGYLTPDKVFFAADTVASPEILDKYEVFFLYDVAAHLSTLDELSRVEADWFVPSHAAPTRDTRQLVEYNKGKIFEIAAFLLETCATPATPEELLVRLSIRFGIELNHTQYVLMGSALRSYLAWLAGKKELASRLEGGRLLFERA
jgi:glyoxylase-like metal-dependent hydrolase (beta-lactamase superfamily II)